MRFRLFTLALLLFSFLFPGYAFSQAPRIKEADLETTSISAGPLKFRLEEYRGSFLKSSPGSTDVEIENVSTDFVSFSPLLLSFVGKDNRQADVRAVRIENYYSPPLTRNIAPGARISEFYYLTAKVKLPARVYYDGKLIAEIIN